MLKQIAYALAYDRRLVAGLAGLALVAIIAAAMGASVMEGARV